jgi:hypothetical protein
MGTTISLLQALASAGRGANAASASDAAAKIKVRMGVLLVGASGPSLPAFERR